MGVIVLGFEAEGFLLGETLRAGTNHALRAVVVSIDKPLKLAIQIDAPTAVVERILGGLEERYQLTAAASEVTPTRWNGHLEGASIEPIFARPLYQKLRALLPAVKHVYASFQAGHGTLRLETSLPVAQLEALKAQLTPDGAPGMSILVREKLDLSDDWGVLLNQLPS